MRTKNFCITLRIQRLNVMNITMQKISGTTIDFTFFKASVISYFFILSWMDVFDLLRDSRCCLWFFFKNLIGFPNTEVNQILDRILGSARIIHSTWVLFLINLSFLPPQWILLVDLGLIFLWSLPVPIRVLRYVWKISVGLKEECVVTV